MYGQLRFAQAAEVCIDSACREPNRLQQVTCSPTIVKAAVNRSITQTSALASWTGDDLLDLVAALMGKQTSAVMGDTPPSDHPQRKQR
ncbi:MAG: hypothetical protein H6728_01505 [Myxococcales bacterium]|nr:hypothetical protein [Myxococcales bacterium]